MCNKTTILWLLLLMAGRPAGAQHLRDTMAVIRNFNDVMAFAVQPYVYYTSTLSMVTGSTFSGKDTSLTLHGNFYKVGDDLYYGTEKEELYVQDSLMVRIDRERKEITVQRIDMTSKKNIDLLPLKRTDRQRLLRGRYLISEFTRGADTGVITIRSQEGKLAWPVENAEMRVEYRKDRHLPLLMEWTMRTRQDGSERVRGHTAAVRFNDLSMEKDKAQQMPLWMAKLAFDRRTGQFSGTGDCAGYTVTKLF